VFFTGLFLLLVQSSPIEPKCFGSDCKSEPARDGTDKKIKHVFVKSGCLRQRLVAAGFTPAPGAPMKGAATRFEMI